MRLQKEYKMMKYKFNEELGRMEYTFCENSVQLDDIVSDEGKEWFAEQLKKVEEQGEEYMQKLIVELANLKYDED